jgi:hypothetical protein
MKIGYREQLVTEEKCCPVVDEISIVYEIPGLSKSDLDHMALTSWNDLEEIKYKSDKKTESQLSKMEIHNRPLYNSEEA